MTGVELPFGAIHARADRLPPASFRSPQQAIELLGQGDPTLLASDAPLWTWLREHEVPPWRPEQPGDAADNSCVALTC